MSDNLTPDVKLRKFTKRRSPMTGKRYPQCQHCRDGIQCEKPVYSDGHCYNHYQAHRLQNSFGESSYRDGLVRDLIRRYEQ